MPRIRDPNRDKAFEIYKKHSGKIDLVEIASQLSAPPGTVRGWKAKDKWEQQLNGTLQTNTERSKQKIKEISWIDIETEYVTDIRKKPCTLEELSNKYEIAMQTIFDYSAANLWSEKRRAYKETTKKKTIEKTAEIISNGIAEHTAKHLSISDRLLDVLNDALSDEDELYKVVVKLRTGYGQGEFDEKITTEVMSALNDTKLLNMVNALDKIQKMQRQTLGIMDEHVKQKLELDKAKAGIGEEVETEDDGFIDALKGKVEDIWEE